MTKGKWASADSAPLMKDPVGKEASGQFSYISAVGMLLYPVGHPPGVSYTVNCCARYMFCPKRLHGLVLQQTGRYLKATRRKGLFLDQSKDICKIDNCLDANLAGMHGHELPTNPSCVKSRTDYVITFADYSVMWQSKL